MNDQFMENYISTIYNINIEQFYINILNVIDQVANTHTDIFLKTLIKWTIDQQDMCNCDYFDDSEFYGIIFVKIGFDHKTYLENTYYTSETLKFLENKIKSFVLNNYTINLVRK